MLLLLLLSLLCVPTKVILDGLKRNMSRGNSLSDELELSSVLGDTRAYLYSPVLGVAIQSRKVTQVGVLCGRYFASVSADACAVRAAVLVLLVLLLCR